MEACRATPSVDFLEAWRATHAFANLEAGGLEGHTHNDEKEDEEEKEEEDDNEDDEKDDNDEKEDEEKDDESGEGR